MKIVKYKTFQVHIFAHKSLINRHSVEFTVIMSNETDDEFEDAVEYQEKEKSDSIFQEKDKDIAEETENFNTKNTSNLNDSDEEQTKRKEDEESEEKILEKKRIQEESLLSEEQLNEKFNSACDIKLEGNTQYNSSNWEEAIFSYTKALEICPLKFTAERSKFYSNRAACYMKIVSFLFLVRKLLYLMVSYTIRRRMKRHS